MADPAFQPDQDDRLSFGLGSSALHGRQSVRAANAQKITEADTEKTECASSQEVATSVRSSLAMITIRPFHGGTSQLVSGAPQRGGIRTVFMKPWAKYIWP